jgi:organic hydroperoxide reductase OsmC/OhrA
MGSVASTARAPHRYTTTCTWSGTTAVGYDSYSRDHEVTADGADAPLRLSSDRAFRGDPDRWNPEVLLVAAASSCHMLSFLAAAARARIEVISYEDRASGEMPDQREPTGLTSIVLRPIVTVRVPVDVAEHETVTRRLGHLNEVAHRECFIANSLRTPVVIEPQFRFAE